MKLAEFRKEFSGAPIDLFEMAETVERELSDSITGIATKQESLVDAAGTLLLAKKRFEAQLVANQIEVG